MKIRANVTCVSIDGRGLLIEGNPGTGKSTLALALVDRGARLVGDDAVALAVQEDRLWAFPPPNIEGAIEIRGIGIASLPAVAAPLCLSLTLGTGADRLPSVESRLFEGFAVPALAFPEHGNALQAEWAMRMHGSAMPAHFI